MRIRHAGEQRKFHPLHRRFNAAQGTATQRNFVRGEDQPEFLLFAFAPEFSEGELIERQQQALLSRQFDFDRASVWIACPAFGCFGAHVVGWVEGDDDGKV